MKWRAFCRMPQWVRLSEWLGCTALLHKKFYRQHTKYQPHDVTLNGEPKAVLCELARDCSSR